MDDNIYQSIVDNVTDMIVITSIPDGIIEFANARHEQTVGWKPEELVGKPLSSIVVREDAESEEAESRRQSAMDQLLSGQAIYPRSVRMIKKNGDTVWVEGTGIGIFEDGKLARFLATYRDITDRLELRKIAERRDDFFRRLIDRSAEPMAIHSGGIIRYVNHEALCLMEADSADDLVGKPIMSVIHPDDQAFALDRVKRALETGEDLEIAEERFITLKGNIRYIELASTHTDWNGEPALHILARDITERKSREQELAHFADIVRESNDAIVTLNLDGKIATWNPAAERLYGWRESEVVGIDYRDIAIPDLFKEQFDSILSRVVAGEDIAAFDTQRLHRGGDLRYVRIAVSGIKRGNGRVVATSAIIHDITDLKKAQEEMALLAAIVDDADDAILSKTLDGAVTSWNKAAEIMYGYSAEEMIGQDVHILAPPTHYAEEDLILQQLKNKSKIYPFDTVRKRKDGTLVNVSLSVSPIIVENRVVGGATIARDITQRKLYEERAYNQAMKND